MAIFTKKPKISEAELEILEKRRKAQGLILTSIGVVGLSLDIALKEAGVSQEEFQQWLAEDEEFKQRVEQFQPSLKS